MGFLDKVKHFAGGHGVKVTHTDIEKQAPGNASMPLTDTVVKGHFVVTSEKSCEVLSMKTEICAKLPKDAQGMERTVVLGSDRFPDAGTTRSEGMLEYPYKAEPGSETRDFFIVRLEKSIPTLLAEHNVPLAQVEVFVRTMVDVKGSPFDPEAKDRLTIQA